MTFEEAIQELLNVKAQMAEESSSTEAVDLAVKALSKQIPKKVGEDAYGWNECTVCYNRGDNLLSNKFKWCPYCGQKLDWT